MHLIYLCLANLFTIVHPGLLDYRYGLSLAQLCPDILCGDGSTNHICTWSLKIKPDARCTEFEFIPMIPRLREIFYNIHNGLRNKVATDLEIANMNLIYWSNELEKMAISYVYRCRIEKDTCKNIGDEKTVVNQNYYFIKHTNLYGRWPGYVVRRWYTELGPATSYKDYLEERLTKTMDNFSQLIWSQTEFFGCSAAKMFGGTFIACYYHPVFDESLLERVIRPGIAATRCPLNRPFKSKTFGGLCGVDIEMGAAGANHKQITFYTMLTIFTVLIFSQVLRP